jgi:outer membrane lipoprotein-sorting protein
VSLIFPVLLLFSWVLAASPANAQEAQKVVDDAIRYYRGKASVCLMDMKISRPKWERNMTIKAWTKGQKKSIFYITAPPKDEGNGTLKIGGEMWTYNPKVNRVMKLPPSMMSQGWMGSDFSNDDLAKSDSIVVDYTHEMEGSETHEGKKVSVIRSTPKPGAAVVWGQQRLKIREDHILLLEEFFDEEKKLVKAMASSQIQAMGGKLFPRLWTMRKADAAGEFTSVRYREIRFDLDLRDDLFSEASLRTAWK